MRSAAVTTRPFIARLPAALFQVSLLLLSQLRDRAWMILLISIGTGFLTQAIREGIGWTSTHLEWGMGMVVFGGLTLTLRSKVEGSK